MARVGRLLRQLHFFLSHRILFTFAFSHIQPHIHTQTRPRRRPSNTYPAWSGLTRNVKYIFVQGLFGLSYPNPHPHTHRHKTPHFCSCLSRRVAHIFSVYRRIVCSSSSSCVLFYFSVLRVHFVFLSPFHRSQRLFSPGLFLLLLADAAADSYYDFFMKHSQHISIRAKSAFRPDHKPAVVVDGRKWAWATLSK